LFNLFFDFGSFDNRRHSDICKRRANIFFEVYCSGMYDNSYPKWTKLFRRVIIVTFFGQGKTPGIDR